MTYAELIQNIQDFLENDEATLVSQIPTITKLVERRIFRRLQLPFYTASQTGSLTINNEHLTTPTDYVSCESLSVVDNGLTYYLKEVDPAFIREAYPDPTATARPKVYAQYDEDSFILGPTPDNAYTVNIEFKLWPESIVTAGTNWIGDNCEDALLKGCIYEAYAFMKGEADLVQLYKTEYEQALAELEITYNFDNRTDSYESGKKAVAQVLYRSARRREGG